jgi:hypothetical protein
MAGVLDLLQAALQNPEALRQLQQEMGRDPEAAPALPPGLPDAVVRSILGGPSYGEGEMTPLRGGQGYGREMPLTQAPQRDQALINQLFAGRQFGPQGGVINEGRGWGGWGMQPPARSPLNQFMPGAGLY